MRIVTVTALLILISAFGCEKSVRQEVKSFSLTMERNNSIGPCNTYSVNIEPDGKVTAKRKCLFFIECENYESNSTSVEKRKCPKTETDRIDKQLSEEELKALIEDVKKSNFFSFQDDYSYNSKNCSQISTDLPNVELSIKLDEKEKTIKHYHGCCVNKWFSKENALQPLENLENKINQTAGIENWTKGAE